MMVKYTVIKINYKKKIFFIIVRKPYVYATWKKIFLTVFRFNNIMQHFLGQM